MKAFKTLLLCSISTLVCGAVLAQEREFPCDDVTEQAAVQIPQNEVESLAAFVPAKTLERVNPRYPEAAARNGQEGWVKMSYVIDENGNVQDPIIDDYAGHRAFKKQALRALKKWTFEPAMKNGKPTQQCHQAIQFDFTMSEGAVRGAKRSFVAKYRDIDALRKDGKIQEAEAKLNELHESNSLNRYENAWLWNMDAMLAEALGQPRRELQSLIRTLASAASHAGGDGTFDQGYLAYLLQKVFLLNARFGFYAEALESAELLANMEGQAERYESVKGSIDIINQHIASAENIFVPIELDERGTFFHTLVRNDFAFSEIKGDLKTVEVRCESHREVFTVAESHVWKIPQGWGQCRVLVQGDSGTAFNLVEVVSS